MSSDRPRTARAYAPEATQAPAPTEAAVAEPEPRKVNPPQAPAALGGMGSTGPLRKVPKDPDLKSTD